MLTTTPTNNTSPEQKAKLTLEPKPPRRPAGNYAYCLGCKQVSSKCSIWYVICCCILSDTDKSHSHLPVRALLFKCTVCMHGGHQECYKMYYLRRPTINLKPQQSATPPQQASIVPPLTPSLQTKSIPRGRTLSKVDDVSDDGIASGKDGASEIGESVGGGISEATARDARALLGHPCAAGCGHYCWATSDVMFSHSSD